MLKSYYKPCPPSHSDVEYTITTFREVAPDPDDPDDVVAVPETMAYKPFAAPTKKQLLASDVTLKKQLKAKVKLEPVASIVSEPDLDQAMADFNSLLND